MDKKYFLYLIVFLLIIILGVFGYFYWQNKKEAELKSLLKQEKKEPIKILTREEILESLTAPLTATSAAKSLESPASKSSEKEKVLQTLTAPKQSKAPLLKSEEREKILKSLSAPN